MEELASSTKPSYLGQMLDNNFFKFFPKVHVMKEQIQDLYQNIEDLREKYLDTDSYGQTRADPQKAIKAQLASLQREFGEWKERVTGAIELASSKSRGDETEINQRISSVIEEMKSMKTNIEEHLVTHDQLDEMRIAFESLVNTSDVGKFFEDIESCAKKEDLEALQKSVQEKF